MASVSEGKMNQLHRVSSLFDRNKFRELTVEMSMAEYLDLCLKNPRLGRNAWQTIFDMIMEDGSETFEEYRKTYTHYNFFDDPEIPIVGLTETKDALVKFIKGAAGHYGTERRVLLLHGPVGSSKSTMCRLIKRRLEKYSRTDAGSWYSYKWVNLPTGPTGVFTTSENQCPLHENPLKLLPIELRQNFITEMNAVLAEQSTEENRYSIRMEGELNPRCKFFMNDLLKRNNGDLEKVLSDHIVVVRKVYSEADRCGIATFQPKDEKNQDSTELTGDINFRLIAQFGADSDPRAFNFDGEFCFPAGSKVRMADGSEKNVEEVVVKDFVTTHTGNSRSVVNTMSRKYTGDLVKLHVRSFPFPISMTSNHPVAVIAGRCDWRWQPGDIVWKQAGDLTEDDRVVIGYNQQSSKRSIIDLVDILGDSCMKLNQEDMECVKLPYSQYNSSLNRHLSVSPSFARFIGLYLAEGGCYENKKVVFNLSALEEELANEIISLGCGLFGVKGTTRIVNERKTGRIVEFHNINLVKVIKHFVPGDVYTKRVPPIFFTSDYQIKLALMLGWLDGDGFSEIRHVRNKPSMRITGITSSEGMARDMTVLALSCGMVACAAKRKARNRSRISYAVDFSGRKALSMIPAMAVSAAESGIKLWEKDTNRTDFGYVRRIRKVEKEQVVNLPVYDFEVEEDHSFLVNDIVVHNCVGNRGMIEFIEALKLDQAFLYDLLGASQEQSIKPKKFSQVLIDEAIFCHTNNPEFEKLKSNQYMEALRDRTVKINVPYTLKWKEEIKILEKDYGPTKVRQHVAPHTLEIAALWAILTRLQDDKDGKLALVDKAELYDGKLLPGWTEDAVKELRDKYPEEGMAFGVSVRYIQDKLSNCLSNNHDYVNAFMVLNELRDGLQDSSLLTNKDQVGRYMSCIDLALKKLTEILKAEVQKALVGDEDANIRLCTNYIDNVMAYINKAKVRDKITGQDRKPDERLMRQVEEKIEIPDQGADDFRRQIAAFIGDLAHKGKQFKWDSNPKLKKALEMKLFEDVKDTIKLSALNVSGASVVDKDIQEKIDGIKTRLINQYGYNERSATDVLDFIGGIFARGDLAEEE